MEGTPRQLDGEMSRRLWSMGVWQATLVVMTCMLLALAALLALLSARATRPANLGINNGRLAPCPDTPNCACSQASDDAHRIEPLRYKGNAVEAMARLRAVLEAWPRTRVLTATDDYLHAECASLVFRFVDDVEFLLDRGAGVIHCRSASRAGRSDLGVNRRRLEAIREALDGS
jgi:uncharacterized protein (DUF1499 family)